MVQILERQKDNGELLTQGLNKGIETAFGLYQSHQKQKNLAESISKMTNSPEVGQLIMQGMEPKDALAAAMTAKYEFSQAQRQEEQGQLSHELLGMGKGGKEVPFKPGQVTGDVTHGKREGEYGEFLKAEEMKKGIRSSEDINKSYKDFAEKRKKKNETPREQAERLRKENPEMWESISKGLKGKEDLSEGERKEVRGLKSAWDSLNELDDLIEKNQEFLGPWGSRKANIYPEGRQAVQEITTRGNALVQFALPVSIKNGQEFQHALHSLTNPASTYETNKGAIEGLKAVIRNNMKQYGMGGETGNVDFAGNKQSSASQEDVNSWLAK